MAPVFIKEMGKVPILAELCQDVKLVVLFPAVDIAEHIWMKLRAGTRRQVLENLDLLSKT